MGSPSKKVTAPNFRGPKTLSVKRSCQQNSPQKKSDGILPLQTLRELGYTGTDTPLRFSCGSALFPSLTLRPMRQFILAFLLSISVCLAPPLARADRVDDY